ncbi:hypothetical protein DZ860_15460 [Vibrio sinensis]|uniref:Ysc84 actin-binding domain-containing protein n=1 Tax=Vibrio sinensis TaxID=2302434 RepID=A0A3A6QAU6_9VIBR|nr:hypothetical protein [Vibrio sinensis]RJX69381.1 hypothetical protein DZ860_15460 [Vibrio sinensis]
MKPLLVLALSVSCIAAPVSADWKAFSTDLSDLTDSVSDGAKDAWKNTKQFSQQAWQDISNWSEGALETAGEWTDESAEKSKQWLDSADKKVEELLEGDTPEEARQAIDLMAETALLRLFNEKPQTKVQFDRAYGYAVFDSRKFSLMFHTNSGSGVAIEKGNDKHTYMRMFGAGLALGIGGKFYQQVVFFENKNTFDEFVTQGWEAASEASLLAGEEGEELGAHFNSGVAVYQLNAKGLLVDANISGSKYWVNKELTDSQ